MPSGLVRVKGPRGWATLGVDSGPRGVRPADIAPTWDIWGPAGMTFSIERDPTEPQPDLAGATPIEYIPPGGGDRASWGGFIHDTPAAGADGGLSVNARGLPFLLDDRPYNRLYALDGLRGFVDSRSLLDVDLANWPADGTINLAESAATLGFAVGAVWPASTAAGITLDLGPDNLAKRIVLALQRGPGSPAGAQLYVRGHDAPAGGHMNSGIADAIAAQAVNATSQAAAGTTYRGTFSTAKRYVSIFIYNGAATYTPTLDDVWKIVACKIFTDTAYEAGDVSVLKSSDVLRYALARVPALDQDVSEITTTATSWPAFGSLGEDRTPRVEMERANDLHRYILRLTAQGRLQFRPRFGSASFEASTRRPGISWVDSTVNSIEDVYNEVVVRARGAGDKPLVVRRLSGDVGIRNVLDRRNRLRTKVLEMPNHSNTTIMQALADAWLQRYARTPLKGSLVATGGAMKTLQGRSVPAGRLGERCGEIVMLSNLDDLDTGYRGRMAITVGAGYNEVEDAVTFAIDNQRDDIEALLARMQVVSGDA